MRRATLARLAAGILMALAGSGSILCWELNREVKESMRKDRSIRPLVSSSQLVSHIPAGGAVYLRKLTSAPFLSARVIGAYEVRVEGRDPDRLMIDRFLEEHGYESLDDANCGLVLVAPDGVHVTANDFKPEPPVHFVPYSTFARQGLPKGFEPSYVVSPHEAMVAHLVTDEREHVLVLGRMKARHSPQQERPRRRI